MSLCYTVRDSSFTSPSSAKTVDVHHGVACSIFALSQNVSIMLERSLHEHLADTSAMEECEDWAGNRSQFSSPLLSQQSQNG